MKYAFATLRGWVTIRVDISVLQDEVAIPFVLIVVWMVLILLWIPMATTLPLWVVLSLLRMIPVVPITVLVILTV